MPGKKDGLKGRLSEITLVDLPKAAVASCEAISGNPEQESGAMIEAWLEKHGLRCGENTACDKEQKGCRSCRIYHQYATLPEGAALAGDDNVAIKEFSGGRFARIAVRDPFADCEFPSAWGILLRWAFKKKIPNRLGCTSKKDCYSLFSNEESPCLEEVYWENGAQYMAMYLPIK